MEWTKEELDALRHHVLAEKKIQLQADTNNSSIVNKAPKTIRPIHSRQNDHTAETPVSSPSFKKAGNFVKDARPPLTPTSKKAHSAAANIEASSGTLTELQDETSKVPKLLIPPPITPLPIRTPLGFSHSEPNKMRAKRQKWQRIARKVGHGCNYRTVKWLWRTLKLRGARDETAQALEALKELSRLVPIRRKEATSARQAIYTTGGGNADHPWAPNQLRQLEGLALENTSKKFRGNKKKRWQHIQKELGFPDRSYKSCQRAFRALVALQKISKAALDSFDKIRRQRTESERHYERCLEYENSCDEKAKTAAKRITTQANLDRELRFTAHITRDEFDMEGRPRALALLLSRGADPDAADAGGFTALMAASRCNACTSVEVLLDHGASVDHADADGHTALYHALEGGAAQAAQLLMRRGATFEDASDHAKGLQYGKLVQQQISKFIDGETQVRDKAERDRRWFIDFEQKHKKAENGRNGCRSRDRQLSKLTLRNLRQWPPKLPPSRRYSRMHLAERRTKGLNSRHASRHSSNLSSRLSSRQGSSGSLGQEALLPAPTALDALRLGLEGSAQRRSRLEREGNEVLRQEANEIAEAERPATYEKNLNDARDQKYKVFTEVKHDLERHRHTLHQARATHLHRANTATS